MDVESYIYRLNKILDRIKILLEEDIDNNEKILDCINEALPEDDSESMSRHMVRRLVYSIKQRKENVLSTYVSFWLLLDIADIVKYLSQYKNTKWNRVSKYIKWNRVEKRYLFENIPPENDDEFEETPYDRVSRWKKD